MNSPKIFQVCEDWFIAHTEEEAKQECMNYMYVAREDVDGDCKEVTEEELETLRFWLDEEGVNYISFKERLDEYIREGEPIPNIFAVNMANA